MLSRALAPRAAVMRSSLAAIRGTAGIRSATATNAMRSATQANMRSTRTLATSAQSTKQAHRVSAASSSSSSSSSSSNTSSTSYTGVWSLLLAGSAVVGAAYVLLPVDSASCAAATPLEEARRIAASETAAKPPPGGWPVFTSEEISKHCTPEDRIWVSYRDGVYDITKFIAMHPGGASKIMLGAGGPIDPFWALYRQHDHESVRMILAQYRIGTLAGYDAAKAAAQVEDPYASDPKRHRALRVSSPKPFNAEPPLSVLGENYITPNELFFVRNHLPVPHIDTNEYKLVVGGQGIVHHAYTLDELKEQFPYHSLTATLQCAGNRRSEMNTVKPVKGLGWGQAAISNAQWGGVRLKDVLIAHGLNPDSAHSQGIKHVHFEGIDADVTGMNYSASVPIEKVIDGSSDVLLAYEMNGDSLPLDHGFPLRAIIPGVVGARNVKWLGEVRTSPVESSGHWQQNDYKGFSPNIDWNNVDFSTAPAIQELPITSAITEPAAGSQVDAQKSMDVKGYAWSGGGRGIVRVDVSPDGGQTWHTARLQPKPVSEPQSLNRAWAWTPWSISLPAEVAKKAAENAKDGQIVLTCKAVDSSYNNQPDTYAPIWNLRGCVGNAWHKVPVNVKN